MPNARDSRETVRVGVIGAGAQATRTHLPALVADPRAQVAAICRRDREALDALAARFSAEATTTDWEALLAEADLDAVVISTPNALHAQQTAAALEAGLHVLVDPPFAVRVRNARALREMAAERNRTLMIGQGRRLDPMWQWAREVVREGKIGRVTHVNAFAVFDAQWLFSGEAAPAWAEPPHPGAWRRDPDLAAGGVLMDSGTALVDLVLWLVGATPEAVHAASERGHLPLEIRSSVELTLAEGTSFTMALVGDGPPRLHERDAILGTDGALYIELDEPVGGPGTRRVLGRTRQGAPIEVPSFPPATAPVTAFLDCLCGGKANPSPPDEATVVVDVVESAYVSARLRRTVEL